MVKSLLKCPLCEEKGIKQTIAEVLPNGFVSVERRHAKQNGWDHTVIRGSDFEIICGNCGSIVFKRERRMRESIVIGQKWFYRIALGSQNGTIGTPSNGNTQSYLGTN